MKKTLTGLILAIATTVAFGAIPAAPNFNTNNFRIVTTNVMLQPQQNLGGLNLTNQGLVVTRPVGATSYVYAAQMGIGQIIIDPRNYNAKVDGGTDDTTAYNLAAVDAAARGGILFVPSGVSIVAGVTIPSNVKLFGDINSTLKLKTLAALNGSPILNVTGTNVIIDGVGFDGNKTMQPADGFSDSFDTGPNGTGRAYRAAIKADGASNNVDTLTVRNSRFVNVFGAPIAVRQINNVSVENSRFTWNNFESLYVDLVNGDTTHTNRNISFIGNLSEHTSSGDNATTGNVLSWLQVQNAVIQNNQAYYFDRNFAKLNGVYGATIQGNIARYGNPDVAYDVLQIDAQSSYMTVQDVNVIGNVFTDVTKGIALDKNPSRVKIIGNTFSNILTSTFGTQLPDGIYVGATNAVDIEISKNTFDVVRRHGIVLVGGTNLVVSGNTVHGVTNSTATFSVGIYLQPLSGASLNTVTVEGNNVSGFNADPNSIGGQIGFVRGGTTETITDLSLRHNWVNAGGALNRAIRSVDTNWITGFTVEGNIVNGIVELLQEGLYAPDNVVSGSFLVSYPSYVRNADALVTLPGDPATYWPAAGVGKMATRTDGTFGQTAYVMSGTGWQRLGNMSTATSGTEDNVPLFYDTGGFLLKNSGISFSGGNLSGITNLFMRGSQTIAPFETFTGNYQHFESTFSIPTGFRFVSTKAGTGTTNYDVSFGSGDTGNLNLLAGGLTKFRVNGTSGDFENANQSIQVDSSGIIYYGSGTASTLLQLDGTKHIVSVAANSPTVNAVFLTPITKAQKTALTPAEGMLVMQSDNTPGIRIYQSGAWMMISTVADP